MKKISILFALFVMGFSGLASAASLSWASTQAGSSITDTDGTEIAVQYGFGNKTGAFSHSYTYQTDSPSIPTDAFYIELLNQFINVSSITLDGVTMAFDAANQRWFGQGLLGQANHTINLAGSVNKKGQQYQIYVETSAVPVPAALWLFGSGIMGLMSFRKGKKIAAV